MKNVWSPGTGLPQPHHSVVVCITDVVVIHSPYTLGEHRKNNHMEGERVAIRPWKSPGLNQVLQALRFLA